VGENAVKTNWLDKPFLSSYVSEKGLSGSTPYVPKHVSGHNPGFPGFRARTSERWFRYWKSKRLTIPVPYINNVGKFTVHQLGTWYTYPEVWFSSVTSTIDSRLWSLFRRRCFQSGYRPSRSDRNLVTRISSLYAFNHNNYYWDRILATLYPKKLGVAKSIFTAFRSRMGETFRFVYSQTSFIVSWLNFRSKWIRGKPYESGLSSLLSFPVVESQSRRRVKFDINPYLETLDYSRVNRLEVDRNGKYYLDS